MKKCKLCQHADEHGSWGQNGTHCRDCHRSWTSLVQEHCTLCHQQFSTTSVADRHWKSGVHVHPAEIAWFSKSEEAYGEVWHGAWAGTPTGTVGEAIVEPEPARVPRPPRFTRLTKKGSA